MSHILDERVDFKRLSEATHIPNVLRFCVKMWCQPHLCGLLAHMMIQSSVGCP